MSGLDNYDQWKTASPYDYGPDPIEEADKLIGMTEDEWSPPLAPREQMLLETLRRVREVLEEETGI